ncbi:NADH-quinone oxidoreductase subunit C [Paenibacillus sp. PR3]|uniref:NADH-quinone oxidoreductase n=2 Tax=Paenibacillus terricola TaxID=2763503 RepID=A0ABR8MXT7_9BACL|nr:NADH-quinone oxidoreductase subunit C [Paenibacillus terricola]
MEAGSAVVGEATAGAVAEAGTEGGATAQATAAADAELSAKRQAAAEARAARAAAKAATEAGSAEGASAPAVPAERPARAPRAAAGAAADAAPSAPKEPSPLQPQLDAAAALVLELVDADAIEEAYVNELGSHMPTLVIRPPYLRRIAELFHAHESLGCTYLRNVSGVDYETHMEVVYYMVNMTSGQRYALKARADRSNPALDSVTPVWETANWNEREIYDLLGIHFHGHPDLRRIMMPDDWIGHPLRKDYEPLDPEV